MFYLVADLHIGQNLRSSLEFENDSFLAVKELTKSIIEDDQKLKTVIIAGDIFGQRRIDGSCLQSFKDMIAAFMHEKIEVFFVQGNHDFNTVPIPTLEKCKHLHKQLYTAEGVDIYGLDYMPTEQLKEELQKVPPCDLLVLHTGFKHLLGFEGAFSITLEDIPSQVKNVLVGHVHKKNVAGLPHGFCVSPGGLHPCAVDQGSEHGYYRSDFNDPGDIQFIQIPTRQIYTWFMFEDENLQETKALLRDLSKKKHYLKPVVVLNYTANMRGAVKILEDSYRDQFIFITDIKSSKVNMTIMSDKISLTDQMKLENTLSEAISPTKEPEVFKFLQQLILSENPFKYVEEQIKITIAEDPKKKVALL